LAWIAFWGAVGLAYVVLVKPEFVAHAYVSIEPRRIANDGPEDLRRYHQFAFDSEQADTELRVLASEHVLRPVFDDLHLAQSAELEFAHNGFWLSVAHWLHQMAPGGGRYDAQSRAYYAFADRVRCLRLGLSYVIEVSYSSQNAALAAQVVNSVAASYMSERLLRLRAHFERMGGAYRVASENALAKELLESRATMSDGHGIPDDLYFADARILGAATAPLVKSYPKPVPAIIFACGFGAISGVLLILAFGASPIRRAAYFAGERRGLYRAAEGYEDKTLDVAK
jgi:uncharacterized protein involved in exopolysaccharide biosynthesis